MAGSSIASCDGLTPCFAPILRYGLSRPTEEAATWVRAPVYAAAPSSIGLRNSSVCGTILCVILSI